MYRAILISDIHCSNALPHSKRNPDTMYTDRLLDTISVLDQAREYANKQEIPDIWILGDLLDKRLADAITLKAVSSALRRMFASQGTFRRVLLVPGNHEAADGAGKHFILDAFTDIGCWVAGVSAPLGEPFTTGASTGDPVFLPLPYQPEKRATEIIESWLPAWKGKGIPLIHQSITGGKMGNWVCPDGVSSELLAQFRFTLSGHFHTRQTLGPKNNIMYIGAPLQHNFGDEGEVRGWTLLGCDYKNVKAALCPAKAPKFHTITLDSQQRPDYADYWSTGSAGDYVTVRSANLEDAKKLCESLIDDGKAAMAKPVLIPKEQQAKNRLVDDSGVAPSAMTWNVALDGYTKMVTTELDRAALLQKGLDFIAAAEGGVK